MEDMWVHQCIRGEPNCLEMALYDVNVLTCSPLKSFNFYYLDIYLYIYLYNYIGAKNILQLTDIIFTPIGIFYNILNACNIC